MSLSVQTDLPVTAAPGYGEERPFRPGVARGRAMPIDTVVAVGGLALLGVSFAVLVPVGVAAWWQHHRERPGRAELSEWRRHATAVARRAALASAEVDAARERAAAAEDARSRAWDDLERAEQAYARARQAYERAGRHVGSPGEQAARRQVADAALAAYRRGDLSQEQAWRVWRWGNGWDPERERREHELVALRAARREARVRYQMATEAERAALRDVAVVQAQARALAEEAELAEAEVTRARSR